jgi:iron(III) transport system substrate-binding protein
VVGFGDAAAGMAIDFYGRTQVDMSGESRVGYIEPADATIVNPDPIAVVKGVTDQALAIRFIEFVVSPEGQRLWNYRVGTPGGPKQTALRRLPVVPSVYADRTYFADKVVSPFEIAGSFNTKRERTGTFKTLGEQIQVSCIDVLDELRDTRKLILASTHASELDRKLGMFPFDQREAKKRQAALNAARPLQRLELIRTWEQEFKAEYKALREQTK